MLRLQSALAVLLLLSACKTEPAATEPAAPAAKEAQPAAAPAAAAPVAMPVPAPINVRDAGLATPESVLYDETADVYLVSNINGAPDAVDNNGFISKVSPEGKVLELKWIAGGEKGVKLDAPKGTAIVGDVLWVADIKTLRMFDAKTGAPKGEVKIPKATFLNDVVAGKDGAVYVSDTGVKTGKDGFVPTGSDAVYVVKPGKKLKAEALIAKKDLGGPNGLAFVGDALVVNTLTSGEVFALDQAGKRTDMPKPPTGGLDGIVPLAAGGFLVSSWGGQKIYKSKTDGYDVVASDLEAPADIGFDAKHRRILVPLFTKNELVLLPFGEPGQSDKVSSVK
ncbi:MAG: SMP-30/gluconolactonase/LRE family protein [Deltaproteobacteria bacterium]|nr:SMP-30/gluconolactonase/LRE family protein [Deltaproteobacteria bacterium]